MDISHQHSKKFISIAIITIYLVAIYCQTQTLINWDTSWGIHLAERTLAGGTYFKDFFETNPPFILYLYMPVVFIAKLFSLKNIAAQPIYIFLVASISLFASYLLIKQIFAKKDEFIAYVFFITVAFIELVLPFYDFGQREHLLLIFTIPYLLITTLRLQGEKLNPYGSFAIGLFAGLGFIIKPFFLATYLLAEIYCIYIRKNLFAWLRPESLGVLFVLCAYLAVIGFYYQNYIYQMVPLLSHFYYISLGDPWSNVILQPYVLYTLFTGILFFIEYKNKQYHFLNTILFIFLIGFLFSYLVQHTKWTYHYFPVLSLAILMNVFLFALTTKYASKTKSEMGYLIILAVLIFSYPIYHVFYTYRESLEYKHELKKVIDFMQANTSGKKIYSLTSEFKNIFPSIDYANAIFASRFPVLSFVPGVVNANYYGKKNQFLTANEESVLVDMVAEDLERNKPDYIFVDVKNYPAFFPVKHFDFVKYFSKNTKFTSMWKNYQYVTTIEQVNKIQMNPNEFNFYIIGDVKNIVPSNMKGKSLILTGEGNHKMAYILIDNQYVYLRDQKFSADVFLNNDDLKKLMSSMDKNKVQRTSRNTGLINQIIGNSIYSGSIPVYKFDVYKLLVT